MAAVTALALLALLTLGVVAAPAPARAVGTVQWIDFIHGKGEVDDDMEAVVADGAGNGCFAGSKTVAGRGSDIVLVKRTPANELKWTAAWGSPAKRGDSAVVAAIDRKRARVYVAGASETRPGPGASSCSRTPRLANASGRVAGRLRAKGSARGAWP